MTPDTYKILHLLGLALMLLGLGSLLATPKDQKAPSSSAILHGIGLLVMLAAGFGHLAKSNMGSPTTWPLWAIGKMGVWLVFAIVPMLIKKGIVSRALGYVLVLLLVATAAWLAIAKPAF